MGGGGESALAVPMCPHITPGGLGPFLSGPREKQSKFVFAQNFVIPCFPILFSKYLVLECEAFQIVYPLLYFHTLEMSPAFPAFLVFLGKQDWKFWKQTCSIRTALILRRPAGSSSVHGCLPLTIGGAGLYVVLVVCLGASFNAKLFCAIYRSTLDFYSR